METPYDRSRSDEASPLDRVRESHFNLPYVGDGRRIPISQVARMVILSREDLRRYRLLISPRVVGKHTNRDGGGAVRQQ